MLRESTLAVELLELPLPAVITVESATDNIPGTLADKPVRVTDPPALGSDPVSVIAVVETGWPTAVTVARTPVACPLKVCASADACPTRNIAAAADNIVKSLVVCFILLPPKAD